MNEELDRLRDKEILYDNEGFAVARCEINDPVLEERIYAYGVYNKTTSVREAETRRLINAVTLCRLLLDATNRPISDTPDQEIDPVQMDLPIRTH